MTVSFQQRSVWGAFKRGFFGRCPKCGEGPLFRAYLKVVPECPSCALDLSPYRSDDGPAYFTILIVGHVFIAPMLFSGFMLTWPVEWVMAVFLSGIVALSLLLLPRVKGAFVGVQWAIGDRAGA
jgi:uncharacterized protein (DUF983 family)